MKINKAVSERTEHKVFLMMFSFRAFPQTHTLTPNQVYGEALNFQIVNDEMITVFSESASSINTG